MNISTHLFEVDEMPFFKQNPGNVATCRLTEQQRKCDCRSLNSGLTMEERFTLV